MFADLLNNDDHFKEKPAISPKLIKWVESNEMCSASLRNGNSCDYLPNTIMRNN